MPHMSWKIYLGLVVIIPFQPEILSVKGGHFSFSLPLLLIFLDPFVLGNSVH